MRWLIDESIPEQIEPHLVEFSPAAIRREGLKGCATAIASRGGGQRLHRHILSRPESSLSAKSRQDRHRSGRHRQHSESMKDILPVLDKIKSAIESVAAGQVIEVHPD